MVDRQYLRASQLLIRHALHETSVLVEVMTVSYERLVFGVEDLTKGLLTLAFCVASAAIESYEER